MKTFLTTTLVQSIRLYQRFLSPDQGMIRLLYPFQPVCGMYPSCSEYAILVIIQDGPLRGILRAAGRIWRCTPYRSNPIDFPR
jgi:uncharacterized protein